MPTFSMTLEDTSPMLQYSANWRPADTETDNFLDQYSLLSGTVTQQQGETMKLTYYGTSVAVFGAKRSNHGTYQGQLDSGPVSGQSGTSGPNQFQSVLFTGNSTQLGIHTVTMTNMQNQFFDIDFVTFETSVGKDNEQLIVNTLQDNHPAFNYTPSSSWSAPQQVGAFSGNSGHSTTDGSAIASLTFQVNTSSCDAIALYGPVGPTGTSKYSVQIDNGTPTVYSAHNNFYRPKEVLFFAGNLGPGNHSLQVQLGTPIDNGVLAIDYANVYTTPSLGGSFLDANFASLTPPAPRATVTTTVIHTVQQTVTPPGVIAGLALMTSLVVFGFIAFSYLYWRQKKELHAEKIRNDKNLDLIGSPTTSSIVHTSEGRNTFHPPPMNTEISHVLDNPIVWPIPNQVSVTPSPPEFASTEMVVPFIAPAAQYATGILSPPGKLRTEYDSASQQQFMQDGQGSSSMSQPLPTQRQRAASRTQSVPPISATTAPPPRYSAMTRQS